jgi:hypothetical protein
MAVTITFFEAEGDAQAGRDEKRILQPRGIAQSFIGTRQVRL